MTIDHPRMRRERKTIGVMIAMYCKNKHQKTGRVCPECQALVDYANHRLDHCPQAGEDKPTCAKCTIHCYVPEKREQIRTVMRFAGPRMLFTHPFLAIRHLFDRRRRGGNPV